MGYARIANGMPTSRRWGAAVRFVSFGLLSARECGLRELETMDRREVSEDRGAPGVRGACAYTVLHVLWMCVCVAARGSEYAPWGQVRVFSRAPTPGPNSHDTWRGLVHVMNGAALRGWSSLCRRFSSQGTPSCHNAWCPLSMSMAGGARGTVTSNYTNTCGADMQGAFSPETDLSKKKCVVKNGTDLFRGWSGMGRHLLTG
ncbi:hypothetical protein V8E55_005793 [Tylopilus felleus]